MFKEKGFGIIYTIILLCFTFYMLMDTFVNVEVYKVVDSTSNYSTTSELNTGEVKSSENSYEDDNIKIQIKEYTQNNTTIHVADIQIKNANLLKTAFAQNSYGKNITEKTSTIAENANAILAINGDYYGVQESGYVLKNGVVYRDTSAGNKEDLVIYEDGSFEIINEAEVDIYSLLNNGAYNILSFGPGLVENGEISVDTNDEVDRAMASNPRTAIGIIDELHYVFVVSDGRTSDNKGLTLYQLASFMKNNLGVKTAYNLDGGGSSSMYFNGEIINEPVSNKSNTSERRVSDIVYIGY